MIAVVIGALGHITAGYFVGRFVGRYVGRRVVARRARKALEKAREVEAVDRLRRRVREGIWQ